MNDTSPKKVIDVMMQNDAFSKWLGIERVFDGTGNSSIKMVVRREMLNGFDILHGGVSFSLADSALAFAANSHGIQSVSIENSIHYHLPAKEGDELTAKANEISKSNKLAVYEVVVTNQKNEKVATFKGTVYRTKNEWKV
ncbi:MAG: hotdog fold thioesterase [Salibacteraceae bacterium]|nr:hotdog fold thioesterase [Salibacteraceae bacterium]|tara:strand:+ start:7828 stop:8247 length:420 start_codon:yes stop_codon:yes gene_type:complete